MDWSVRAVIIVAIALAWWLVSSPRGLGVPPDAVRFKLHGCALVNPGWTVDAKEVERRDFDPKAAINVGADRLEVGVVRERLLEIARIDAGQARIGVAEGGSGPERVGALCRFLVPGEGAWTQQEELKVDRLAATRYAGPDPAGEQVVVVPGAERTYLIAAAPEFLDKVLPQFRVTERPHAFMHAIRFVYANMLEPWLWGILSVLGTFLGWLLFSPGPAQEPKAR
ncbi:MAG: hypothetical protein HY926_14185 [Elusimicrobia bacterium]|nr:hypothetical protein [Elusimicrobiota bacterium]